MGQKIFVFTDSNGNIICREKLTSLPIKEKCIIEKSIELFSDCEPCIIHRSYVMKKIIFEIDEYIDIIINQGERDIIIEDISKNILDYLELKGIPHKLYIL